MAKVPNAVERLPKITTAWVGCTSVTDDRQTDGRQMDGRHQIANVNVSWRSLKTEIHLLQSLRFFIFFIWLKRGSIDLINIYQHNAVLMYCIYTLLFFLVVVAISDLNVVFLPVNRPVKSRHFRRSTGRFNRRVTGRVESRKSRPVPSLLYLCSYELVALSCTRLPTRVVAECAILLKDAS